jgi:hypothetical protein
MFTSIKPGLPIVGWVTYMVMAVLFCDNRESVASGCSALFHL